jgi:hypothetical protein
LDDEPDRVGDIDRSCIVAGEDDDGLAGIEGVVAEDDFDGGGMDIKIRRKWKKPFLISYRPKRRSMHRSPSSPG